MSVHLNPSSSLGFNRPLTELVKRTLTITNHNALPVAFKIKTTAPKLYCVRPNAGRIEPGESVGVSVQLQPMREEPPSSVKCKDKFLVQSTTITPDKESLSLAEIWAPAEGESEVKVHEQKIKVVYLPPEGQIVEEEAEEAAAPPQQSHHTLASDHFETVRQQASSLNGHAPAMPSFEQPPVRRSPTPEHRQPSPPVDDSFVAAREEQSRLEERHESRLTPEPRQPSPGPIVNVNVHTPSPTQPPPPADHAFASSANTSSGNTAGAQERELALKLAEAHSEIQQLRALLAATPDPAELRRRANVLSPEETVVSEGDALSDVGTTFTERPARQDGASPQQVGIIALLVFVITYLFF